jgi:hypothetical protein
MEHGAAPAISHIPLDSPIRRLRSLSITEIPLIPLIPLQGGKRTRSPPFENLKALKALCAINGLKRTINPALFGHSKAPKTSKDASPKSSPILTHRRRLGIQSSGNVSLRRNRTAIIGSSRYNMVPFVGMVPTHMLSSMPLAALPSLKFSYLDVLIAASKANTPQEDMQLPFNLQIHKLVTDDALQFLGPSMTKGQGQIHDPANRAYQSSSLLEPKARLKVGQYAVQQNQCNPPVPPVSQQGVLPNLCTALSTHASPPPSIANPQPSLVSLAGLTYVPNPRALQVERTIRPRPHAFRDIDDQQLHAIFTKHADPTTALINNSQLWYV